jgi:hypothetical protein
MYRRMHRSRSKVPEDTRMTPIRRSLLGTARDRHTPRTRTSAQFCQKGRARAAAPSPAPEGTP